jgi:hypothetical protein
LTLPDCQNHEDASCVVPAGTPAWIAPELIEATIPTWQPYDKTPFSTDNAVEIIRNAGLLFEDSGLLVNALRWSTEELKLAGFKHAAIPKNAALRKRLSKFFDACGGDLRLLQLQTLQLLAAREELDAGVGNIRFGEEHVFKFSAVFQVIKAGVRDLCIAQRKGFQFSVLLQRS